MTAASSLSSLGKKSNSVKSSKFAKFKMARSDFIIAKSDFVRSRESICAPKKIKLELLRLSSVKNNKKSSLSNSTTNSLNRISPIKEITTAIEEKTLINLKGENGLSTSEFVQPL